MKRLTKQKAIKRIESFRVKVYLLFIKSSLTGTFDDYAVEYSSELLNYGEWGSKFYDTLLMLYPCTQNYSTWGADKYCDIVKEYTSSISLIEHFTNCKKLIYNMVDLDSSLNSVVLSLISFLSMFYTDGELYGIDKDMVPIQSTYNFYSTMDSDTIVFFDILCWHFLNKDFSMQNPDTEEVFTVALNNNLTSLIKDCQAFVYSSIKQSTIKELASDLDSAELFAWFISQYPALYCSKFWISSPQPESSCGFFYRWERENFQLGKTMDENLIIFQILQSFPSNILMHRKFYIRESGVIVKFKNPIDAQIEYLHMIETHENGYDCVIASYRVNGVTRSIPLFMENFTASLKLLMYELDLAVLPMILSILGISKWVANNSESLTVPDLSNLPGMSPKKYREIIKDTLLFWDSSTEKSGVYYEEPVNWNYESRSVKPLRSNDTKIIGTRKVTVGRYTRKLPEGYHASTEARMLATKYKMILEPGYTFVDEFEKEVPIRSTSEF